MPDEAGATSPRRRLSPAFRRAAWLILFAVAATYFAHQVFLYRSELSALASRPGALRGVILAGAVLAISTLMDAWAWGFLLRVLGVGARTRQAVASFCVAQLGKYVPGNIAHHAARVALGKAAGFNPGRVVMSLFVENGFALGAGALVGGLGLFLIGRQSIGQAALLAPLLLVVGFGAGVVLLRRWFAEPPRFLVRWLDLREPVSIPLSSLTTYFLLHVVSYGMLGGGLAFVITGIGREWGTWVWDLPLVIAASFLVRIPGAPAGLGVRETVMITLLTPVTGAPVAVSAAVLFRLAATLADAVAFLLGLGLGARKGSERRAE